MNLNNLHSIYFLGIGGIGMSALALYFHKNGMKVSGYDRTQTSLTNKLQAEGINIHYQDDIDKIPENIDLVIYTPAIPGDLKELQYLKNKGVQILKRSEVIKILTSEKQTIAVAGTHGKTTVTTLIAHLLTQSKIGCSAFLGGISKNYDANLLTSDSSGWMVVEADEYDRSFLNLYPTIGIITSLDADHLDIYGDFENLKSSFRQFAEQIKNDGLLIIKKGIELNPDQSTGLKIYNYSINEKADFYTENIKLKGDKYIFDLITPENQISGLELGIPGLINVENAVAAVAAAYLTGAEEHELKSALSLFTGIHRRFDYRIKTENLIYIDDYAHHPEELKGIINSVRKIYPEKTILGIFQPHLYSRTRDFADEFAESLELLDEVILLPIYPAREKPIEGVSSQMILNKITKRNNQLCSKEELIDEIAKKKYDILLTLGAGDIDRLVQPIQKFFTETRIKQKV